MRTKDYQASIRDMFQEIFRNEPEATAQVEWRVMASVQGIYCPKVDVAVGPYSTDRGQTKQFVYDRILDHHTDLLNALIEAHNLNLREHNGPRAQVSFNDVFNGNRNGRCMIAVEIEREVSRKHQMGGYINTGAIGRVGLAVAWNTTMLKSFIRMAGYFEFLQSVGKRSFISPNVLILDAEQLHEILKVYSQKQTKRAHSLILNG